MFMPLKVIIFMPLSVIIVIIIIITVAMHRSQFTYTLSIIIAKHQYPETTFTGLTIDRMHAYICIYNSKYFIQSENSFSYIFIDYMLLDFWCAFDMLKIKCSENDFSSKSGTFSMYHRDGYVLKGYNRFQISILLRISLFLFGFEHREFRISYFKFECL